MRQQLMQHFLRMRAPYFEKFRTGDLMARATQDIRSVAETTGYGMLVLVSSIADTIMIVLMMGTTVSWRLTIVTILPMIL